MTVGSPRRGQPRMHTRGRGAPWARGPRHRVLSLPSGFSVPCSGLAVGGGVLSLDRVCTEALGAGSPPLSAVYDFLRAPVQKRGALCRQVFPQTRTFPNHLCSRQASLLEPSFALFYFFIFFPSTSTY